MPYKFGMKPYVQGSIEFRYKDYLNEAKLPALPLVFGHIGNVPPTMQGSNVAQWGMLGNDQYGNCTIAGIAHGVMLYAMATNRPVPLFNAQVCIDQYLALTNGRDDGLDIDMVANWFRQVGIKDASGKMHHCKAYGTVNNVNEQLMATYLFGFSGLGLALPSSAIDQFEAGQTWDDLRGDGRDGHYIPVVGRNHAGHLIVVTWNKLQAMTIAFYNKYKMVGIGYFSEEYLLANGQSPELINEATLDDDLSAVTV